MKEKGKSWLSFALTCFLCWTCSAQALAETISQENSGQAAAYGSVDVSSMVYQAGGLGTPIRGDSEIAIYAISASDQIKSEILQALLAREESLDVSAYEMPKEELWILFAEVLNENGELFYVKSALRYWIVDEKVTKLGFKYDSVIDEQKQAFVDKLAEATALVTDTMSEMEKALVLHDYLAQHCAYANQEYLDGTLDSCPNVFDAYGALVRGKAVCQGYAEAYKTLLGAVGIQSSVCSSRAMGHAWNIVFIDGNWYHVDVTWDDPTWNREGRACHEYFLLSDTEMTAREHTGWETDIQCDSQKYDDYWWREVDSQIVQIASQDYIYVKNNKGKFQLVRRTDETETVLYNNNLYWNVWGSYSYWTTAFAFLSRQGNDIYFNDRARVFSLNLDNLTESAPKVEYTYDKNDGYIYGAMVYEDGKICLNIYQAPNEKTDDYIEAGKIIMPSVYCISGMVGHFGSLTVPTLVELIDVQGKVTAKRSVTGSTVEYRLKNIPAGTYTLHVSRPDHVTGKYSIVVIDTDIKQDVELQLLGDVNGDRTINARDKKILYNHIEKISELTGYLFDVGDVNGDGTINARDKKLLYNHIERIALLWEY